MKWEDFLKRCQFLRIGHREEHVHIRAARLLEDLGWLARFEFQWTTDNYPKTEGLDTRMWTEEILQEASERCLRERLYLELRLDNGLLYGEAQVQSKLPDADYRRGPPHTCIQTDDPHTLEFWLRRQPVVWP